MRTIYSPYKNKTNPSDPASGSQPVKKERESLSSQTLGTCPTWTSTDDNSLYDTHESNIENKDPVAPKSTTKERKQWIENTLLTKKEYTPFNTPAREEYCKNKSNRDLTAERKHWIETTLLTKEQKTYNTKTREEYCKNKDNHELTNERKRWIEETLLTKTNTLPSTPSNKRFKSDDSDMKENATCEIVEEAQAPLVQRLHQFTGPSEIDRELMQKLKKRAEAEANPSAVEEIRPWEGEAKASKHAKIDKELMQKLQKRKQAEADPNAAEEAWQLQLLAQEEAKQLQLMEQMEEEAMQRQLLAEEEARQLQLMKQMEAEARQQQEKEMRQRLAVEEEARQRQRMAEEEELRQRQLIEEETKRMEQKRINEEAKLAEEAIAALQKRLDEERLKRELLEEEARLAKEARDAEHQRFVELAENAKMYETRIGELEQQEQQRSKMRAYITTLKEEKKLRADELAIVEELEKDIESDDDADDDEVVAEEYQAYLSNYRSMSEHISTMGSNNIFALTNQKDEKDVCNLSSSTCPQEKTDHVRTEIGVQPNMPRRTPMVIRSVGSFADMAEMKQAKKHKKRMKLLEKLVKLLGRNKKHEC
ncbi:hypothetical protein ACHAWT_009605 [Skeletonema menzelii]